MRHDPEQTRSGVINSSSNHEQSTRVLIRRGCAFLRAPDRVASRNAEDLSHFNSDPLDSRQSSGPWTHERTEVGLDLVSRSLSFTGPFLNHLRSDQER
jgi:hypothetical protein